MEKERTSILLDKPVMNQLRKKARQKGITLSALISLLLREGLRAISQPTVEHYQFRPLIIKGSSLPRINVSDRKALFDLWDSEK